MTRAALRLGAFCIVSGQVFLGFNLLFHPLTTDPYAVGSMLAEIRSRPHWALIHWGFAAGMIQWLIGLLAFDGFLRVRRAAVFSPFAAAAVVAALPVWLVVMTLEASAGPILAGGNGAGADAVFLLARSLLPFAHLLGYVAAFLPWAAVGLWGVDLLLAGLWPRWFGWWGVLAGAIGAAALPVAAVIGSARFAVPLLALTSGPAVVWTLVLAYYLWEKAEGPGAPGP